MRILLLRRSYERLAGVLSARVPGLEPVLMDDDGTLTFEAQTTSIEEAAPEAAWANTELYGEGPVREFMIACLKSETLRFIQSGAAGFDHPVFGMLVDRGVALANSDASSISIAEFVMAQVLDVFQPHHVRRELQAARRWERNPFREVCGTIWLIVGMGSVGCEVARRATAFSAQVVGVRRAPRGDEPAHRMVVPSELADALPLADVIVLAAAANADSLHMIDAAALARMKRDAVLVNIARGALIDEAALLESLEDGRPGTAILDVFEREPLPDDSPLWLHPRVRISAHNAAAGDGFTRRGDEVFLRNAERLLSGETLERLVDPAVVKASVQGNQ